MSFNKIGNYTGMFRIILSLICLVLLSCSEEREPQPSSPHQISQTIECLPTAGYPGGWNSLKIFMQENIHHPSGTLCYAGVVFVSFLVHEDGTLSDFKVLRSLTPTCDENALAGLKRMPNWIPAMQDGRPIASRMVLPVRFGL